MDSPPPFDPADPTWLAHRYDRPREMLWFRHVPRAMHAAGPFLTDELVGEAPEARLDRAAAVAAARPVAVPAHFIFHSAFCASTLLARALDIPGVAMGLSEPVLLNDVVGIRRRGELPPRDVAHLLDDALLLLRRRWGQDQAVVLKPSNILNPLAPVMLAMRPEARAILMHAPLRQYLSSVARKGLWCRLWVRELLEGLLIDGVVDLGFAAKDYLRLTDLQVAAVGWLAQHRLFHDLVARVGPSRVRTLDSETLLARPAAVLAAAGSLLDLGIDAALADSTAAGPVFTTHSKTGERFGRDGRAADRAAAETAHGDEIDKVHHWALAVAERQGLALTLPAPLLD